MILKRFLIVLKAGLKCSQSGILRKDILMFIFSYVAYETLKVRIDENEVEKHCGSKYLRGNGENRYQRGGTSERGPVTAVGKLNVTLHKVVDTEAKKTFKPINSVVDLDGKKIYQEDISMIA